MFKCILSYIWKKTFWKDRFRIVGLGLYIKICPVNRERNNHGSSEQTILMSTEFYFILLVNYSTVAWKFENWNLHVPRGLVSLSVFINSHNGRMSNWLTCLSGGLHEVCRATCDYGQQINERLPIVDDRSCGLAKSSPSRKLCPIIVDLTSVQWVLAMSDPRGLPNNSIQFSSPGFTRRTAGCEPRTIATLLH